jgi:molybdopterin molybdotransferase
MDGYAVRVAEIAPGALLPVVGEARTGQAPGRLASRTAMRIFTGAALPEGADAVVMQERVVRDGARARFEHSPKPGENVRRQGEDLARGAEALTAGSRISPGALMLATSLDITSCVVTRRPRVTILCTGNELRDSGHSGSLGMIPESNSPGIRALAMLSGADVTVAPLVADEPGLVRDAITSALQASDLLVTVGGVSVGDHDYVRSALGDVGVKLDFWKVAIKPGKPLAFGRIGMQAVLALPGNPASCLVTFALFGVPLLRAMQADRQCVPLPTYVPCACDLKRHPERMVIVMGSLVHGGERSAFLPHPNQSSGATLALAAGDGFALIEFGDSPCREGTLVPFVSWT